MLDREPLNFQRLLTHLQTLSSPISVPISSPISVPSVEAPTVTASPFSVHFFETVASTNVEVWRLLEQGAAEGVVAIAQQQQSGRGQRGRTWQSPCGGLYLSLGMTPHLPSQDAVRLTLGCAWGIAAALRQRRIPVGIKWLNDLVLEGKKLGGILTETRMQQGRIHQAVVGIGMNWSNPVPDVGINLATWVQSQPQPTVSSLEELGAIALQGAFAGYQMAKQGHSAELVACYESVFVNRGQTVNLQTSSLKEEGTGKVLGITADGALRVQYPADATTEIYLQPGTIQLGYPTPSLPLERDNHN